MTVSRIGLISFVVCLYGHARGLAGVSTRWARFPPRREIINLQDFRSKVADIKWYQLYFGSAFLPESVFQNGEFEIVPVESTPQVTIKIKADISSNGSVTCLTEADLGNPVLNLANSLGEKAEFTADTGSYWTFFSSDLNSYLLSFECASGRRILRCPLLDTFISIFVKSVRPDSVPLQGALRDLWRVVGLTLDVDPDNYPFVFTLGENTCPAPVVPW